jgi:DNA-directed RNA polymerase omega subunit
MAKITSQVAASKVGGQFELVLVASQRAREIRRGSAPRVVTNSGPLVTAVKEIEEGLYTREDYMSSLRKKR